jgi:Mlc titration factor MtfA (ptsG expression regulator)
MPLMIFSWLKRRRRARVLASPFPEAWLKILAQNVPHYGLLYPEEQETLRRDVQIFVAEKNWEGCGGLALTDEIKVTVAAQASLLVLARELDELDRVLSILIYPSEYAVPTQVPQHGHVIAEELARSGEAWYRGPVVLNWTDVLRESRDLGGGNNLVWHEFAHQLDMLDRETDGTPPLDNRAQYRRWTDVMTAEYDRLKASARSGQPTLLDPYGTTNEGEFFAVVTVCFFDQPIEMRAEHPELYALLAEFFRQDTAARLQRAQTRRR